MHKILMVIRREYLERVKKKSFWIGTMIFPLLMLLLVGGQFLLTRLSPDEQRRILLIDATGKIDQPLREELAEEKLTTGQPRFVLETVPVTGDLDVARKTVEPRAAKGEVFGIVTAGSDLGDKENFKFYGKNVGNVQVLEPLERALRKAVIRIRMDDLKLNLDRGVIDKLIARVDLQSFQVSLTGAAQKKGFLEAYLGTFGFVIILFMSMLLYGVAVMRGILEEKSNRVMEVLLGSLTPDQLMTGKILGIGLVGLTQMGVYAVTAVLLQLVGLANARAEMLQTVLGILSLKNIGFMIVFFILGYFMYTGLFAAIGAVCNSEQEAQNLQAPVTWTLMIPMVTTFYFVNNPDSTLAVVVSLIPIFTPMVMFMRISLVPTPAWQVALSIVLVLGTIYLIFRGTAKVFRIGILMYGKKPTIPEIIRWART